MDVSALISNLGFASALVHFLVSAGLISIRMKKTNKVDDSKLEPSNGGNQIYTIRQQQQQSSSPNEDEHLERSKLKVDAELSKHSVC